jgi:hypothetical protein
LHQDIDDDGLIDTGTAAENEPVAVASVTLANNETETAMFDSINTVLPAATEQAWIVALDSETAVSTAALCHRDAFYSPARWLAVIALLSIMTLAWRGARRRRWAVAFALAAAAGCARVGFEGYWRGQVGIVANPDVLVTTAEGQEAQVRGAPIGGPVRSFVIGPRGTWHPATLGP